MMGLPHRQKKVDDSVRLKIIQVWEESKLTRAELSSRFSVPEYKISEILKEHRKESV